MVEFRKLFEIVGQENKPVIIPILRSLPTSSGGIQKNAYNLYEFLSKDGYEITLLVHGQNFEYSRYNQFKVLISPLPRVYRFSISKYYSFQQKVDLIQKAVKELYPNRRLIFIAHWAPDFIMLGKLKYSFPSKSIFFFHGPYHLRVFEKLATYSILNKNLRAINRIDHFIFISKSLYEKASQNEVLRSKKLNVFRNGVIVDNNAKRNPVREEVKFIVASRLVENKNVDNIIKAFSAISKNEIKYQLDIYGDGPMENELKQLVFNLGLSGEVNFKGYEPDIKSKMKDYNFLISASSFEGLPLAPLEAISNGIIPILSDIDSHKEITPMGSQIILFGKGVDALKSKIEELCFLNESKADILFENLKMRLLENFDINKRNEKVLELIRSIE